MESLKFLMISTHYPPGHLGGDARFVEYLSNELVRAGHEVHVLHSPYAFALQRGSLPEMSKTTSEGVQVDSHLPPYGRLAPILGLAMGHSPGSGRDLREIASKLKPDVVHWHNTKGFIGRPIPLAGSLTLYTAHDYYAVCPKSSLLRPNQEPCESPFFCQSCLVRSGKPPQLWRASWMRVVRMSDEIEVISPSRFLAERLLRDGLRVDHILRNFSPDLGFRPLRKSPEKIIYLGVLERFKGVLTLLEAFNQCKDLQGFELTILGEGSLRYELEHRVESLGLEGRVKTMGYVPLQQIDHVIREAAAIVVPSESYENAPLVALEALSMGIPILGSAIGGLPEILTLESGCTLVPPRDPSHLAEEIVKLWNDRESLTERSERARAAYESTYSPGAHVREYLRIVSQRET